MQRAESCPHCNVVADVEPHAALGFRCRVCGGPRVPVDAPGVQLSTGTRQALERAKSEHKKHLLLSAAGLALLGLSGLSLLAAGLVLLAASPGLVPTVMTLVACAVPLAGGAWGLWRAAAARGARGEELHRARTGALGDAQAVLGALDAERVAQLMRIDAEHAELLLAEVSVARLLSDAPLPRLRVDEPLAKAEAGEPASDAQEPAPLTQRTSTER